MQLKNAIKEVGVPEDAIIYLHLRPGKVLEIKAGEVDEKELKRHVDIVQYGHGNREIGCELLGYK